MATSKKPLGDADGRHLARAREYNQQAIDLLTTAVDAGPGDQPSLLARVMASLANVSTALVEMQLIRDKHSPRKKG